MSDSILVTYAPPGGSTQKVAQIIADVLRESDFEVDLCSLNDVHTIATYSAVVIGASLLRHHWHKNALLFLSRCQHELVERHVAVFTLGSSYKHSGNEMEQDLRAQIEKDLSRYPWFRPLSLGIFYGTHSPISLPALLNMLIGKEPSNDILDWAAISQWGICLIEKIIKTGRDVWTEEFE